MMKTQFFFTFLYIIFFNPLSTNYGKPKPILQKGLPVVIRIGDGDNKKNLEDIVQNILKQKNYSIISSQRAKEILMSDVQDAARREKTSSSNINDVVNYSKRFVQNMLPSYQSLYINIKLDDKSKIDSCTYFVKLVNSNGSKPQGGFLHDSLLQKNDLFYLMNCVIDSLTINK